MSAIPAQTLLDESTCYMCYGVSQAEALKLALLNRIASGGSSGAAVWGGITGTLSNQLDLQAALDLKATTAALTAGLANKVVYFVDYPNFTSVNSVAEQTAYTLAIPANSLGVNGSIRVTVLVDCTVASGNNSTIRAYYNAGLNFLGVQTNNFVSLQLVGGMFNAGATNSQIAYNPSTPPDCPGGKSNSNLITGAIDSTAAQNLIVTLQKQTGTDSLRLRSVITEIFKS